MPRKHDFSPIFVVGAPRSGGKLLAWGLAQHPELELRPGGRWLGALASALGPLHHAAAAATDGGPPLQAGGTLDDFLAPFARAAAELLNPGAAGREESGARVPGPPYRWVDGYPGNAFHAYAISRLVPGARFIHVVRGVEAVVRHLSTSRTPDSAYFTQRSGVEAWLRYVHTCLQVEQAMGPGRTLRVLHRDLALDPEGAVRRCLDFLGESYHPACARTFRGMRPDPEASGSGSGTAWDVEEGEEIHAEERTNRLRREAALLSRTLLSGDWPPAGVGSGDPEGSLEEVWLRGTGRVGVDGDPSSPLERIRSVVGAGVPEGATVLVVSRGDEELLRLPGRIGWHFPQVEGGVYAGHHPGDSAEAVAGLKELQGRGADFLVIPCTSFWWLDHYTGFSRYLDRHHRLVAFHEDLCLLFALNPEGGTHSHPQEGRARLRKGPVPVEVADR